MMDSDLLVPEKSMRAILKKETCTAYGHRAIAYRVSIANQQQPDGSYVMHPSSGLIDKDAYWSCGGNEEDLTGNYGYEDLALWVRYRQNPFNVEVQKDDEVQMSLFDVEPCSEALLPFSKVPACVKARNQLVPFSRETHINLAKLKRRRHTGCWSNKYLRFPWVLHEAE
jgi:hypothetical protein